MRAFAVRFDRRHHGKLHAVVLDKATDLRRLLVLLASELQGWEGDDRQPLILELCIELNKLAIVPRGCASSRRDVHDEDDVALDRGEVHCPTFERRRGEAKEGAWERGRRHRAAE